MRYKLHAYVCDAHCVQWIGSEGSLDFTDIMTQRPHECRFAILERDNVYYCLDLLAVRVDVTTLKVHEPKPMPFATLDGAIMAAQMQLYKP